MALVVMNETGRCQGPSRWTKNLSRTEDAQSSGEDSGGSSGHPKKIGRYTILGTLGQGRVWKGLPSP